MKTALVAGASGLVGGQLLSLLLEDSNYGNVKCVTRSAIAQSHPKIQNIVTDLDGLASHKNALGADDVFCCLGTTMKIAGDKEAFKRVDFEYPLQLAQLTKEMGAKQYFLISALGADPNSSVFYNKVKGEAESAIEKIDFEAFHIFRPSLLLGPRNDQRAGEEAAKIVMKLFGFLVPKKYKAIESVKVAEAMIKYARQNAPGKFIHESLTLQ